MFNTLLFLHIVVAVLLIITILLQKTSTDGLSGIGGGSGGNMGLISNRSAANFMSKATIILATIFFINAIILANLSSRQSVSSLHKNLTQEIETSKNIEIDSLPVAK